MSQSKRKQRRGFPPADSQPSDQKKSKPSSPASSGSPIRWGPILLFLLVSIGGTYMYLWLRPSEEVPQLTFEIVNTYPHDPQAFTQGLLFHEGQLYESTGKEGASSLRRVDLKTGEVLQQHNLDADVFGEGLAVAGDKFYQLSWQNNLIFVYDQAFNEIKRVRYDHEGWGLAYDGQDLIASDGTNWLRFLDPETLEEKRIVRVRKGDRFVSRLNELEMYGPDLYANVFQQDLIYWIDADTGQVKAEIDLTGLWPSDQRPNREAVLNGIAIDSNQGQTGTMFVTGKYCPFIWEIKLVAKK